MVSKSIAVLLATYNGEKYIKEFLDSLLMQKNQDFMLIVGDDGSTDSTLAILSSYAEKIDINILPGTKKLGPARNFVRILADAGEDFKYFFFADQDDFWNEEKIDRALLKLNGLDDTPSMYCSALELVDSELKHISFSSYPREISLENALVENIATGCTIAINSKARRAFIEGTPKNILMHDWLMYILISSIGTVVYDKYYSLKYRQHGGNSVGAATGVFHDIYRRTRRFFNKSNDGVFCISGQAENFYQSYSHLLGEEKKSTVLELVNGKKSILGRFGLALKSGFFRQRKMDTFILKFLFLIGKF
ncbi:glycosyltransferase family 2 protein [Janthinobacterium lividum]|uniref:glycosyltransferase family 2 protein n=1 Tax=Janthinobacterium lividum TaxID=29581 RepID=UPI0009BD5C85|nr:glycosyltransferase family 2 protein [Janthinobacterium lividum]